MVSLLLIHNVRIPHFCLRSSFFYHSRTVVSVSSSFNMSKSWLSIAPESPFSIANIPFGIISTSENPKPRAAIAIGDSALDLCAFGSGGGFSKLESIQPHLSVFQQPTLNDFAALNLHRQTRRYLQLVLSDDTQHPELLKSNNDLQKKALIPLSSVKTYVPLHIGDYTDFYAGKQS